MLEAIRKYWELVLVPFIVLTAIQACIIGLYLAMDWVHNGRWE